MQLPRRSEQLPLEPHRPQMRKPLDFKLQADDVLNRQISGKTDPLSLDDAPPRAWISRLLQACAS